MGQQFRVSGRQRFGRRTVCDDAEQPGDGDDGDGAIAYSTIAQVRVFIVATSATAPNASQTANAAMNPLPCIPTADA